jgi:hypothetical protein
MGIMQQARLIEYIRIKIKLILLSILFSTFSQSAISQQRSEYISIKNSFIELKSPITKIWSFQPTSDPIDETLEKIDLSIRRVYTDHIYSPYLWPAKQRKLMLHCFYLKYKTPDYPPIRYQPEYLQKKFLPQTQLSRFDYYDAKKLNSKFDKEYYFIYTVLDSFSIYKPQFISYIYDKIPSPHRFLLDGEKMVKKSADATFKLVNIESKRKLVKPVNEVVYWIYSGEEIVQISQNNETNWVQGGNDNVSLLSDLRASANYKKDKIAWDNKGIHKLGINKNDNEQMRINSDLIQLTSKFGVNASKKWYYSAFFDFKTQFFYGRDANSKILSGFMSPGYITSAVGMDYKQSKDFTVLLSPITSKITTVLDTIHVDQGRYKVPTGKRTSSHSGASINSNLKWKISNEFRLEYALDLFYGYLSKNPETQLDAEIIFNMRINRFLSTRLNARFRYFENESDRLQFKENFSIAFSYRF